MRASRGGAQVVAADLDPAEAAASGHLRYVTDRAPGIARLRAGKGFRYRAADGSFVRSPQVLARIRALAIPPAWTEVWICTLPHGHLQAVGRDARGRKQYRYHPRWRAVRDETKYARLAAFGRALPAIRRRVHEDMRRPGLPREKVLAAAVGLLETTLIRVGNEEYARQNGSYGLTTLRSKHVRVKGARVRFEFVGKGGKPHVVDLDDRRLAHVVRQCRDLPGHELFQYVDDDGRRQSIDSADVNAYLREISGQDFTAKDFRTWGGTVLAAAALRGLEAGSATRARKQIVQAVATVAEQMRNTPAICRKSYIHPAVFEAFQAAALGPPITVVQRGHRGPSLTLDPGERAVLRVLERATRRTSRR
jgi:DNA topoisomerase-1